MRFFSQRRARLYEQYTPKVLIGLRGHLILKGLEFLFLQDPIQIRFVLLKLVTKPESSLKGSNKSEKARGEVKSARVVVVPSAYWSSFDSCPSIEMLLILVFCRIAIAITSTSSTKR